MATLQVGHHPEGHFRDGQPRRIEIPESQMARLGFRIGQKAKKIGCGDMGCVYLPTPSSDAVVKITIDAVDALASHAVMTAPPGATWAVPIYAVWRIRRPYYAICAARADDIDGSWGDVVEEIFEWAEENDLGAAQWDRLYSMTIANVAVDELARGTSERTKQWRQALETINSAVMSFRGLGYNFVDFHKDNFGMYQGRPVVRDLGATRIGGSEDSDLEDAERLIPLLPTG